MDESLRSAVRTGGISLGALTLILVLGTWLTKSTAAQTVAAPSGQILMPITPCRVADTRTASHPLASGETRTFAISGLCGIPASATAYVLNATVVPSGSLGFITLWPTGQAQPLASTLNAVTGQITANAAIIPAGTNGSINVYASDATDLVLDVSGYFVPVASALKSYEQCWTPAATVLNGTGTSFTLARAPAGLVQLFLNGLYEPTSTYALGGSAITWTHGVTPQDSLCAVYQSAAQ